MFNIFLLLSLKLCWKNTCLLDSCIEKYFVSIKTVELLRHLNLRA